MTGRTGTTPCRSIHGDERAQMLTLEATLAALILITATLFLTQFIPTTSVGESGGTVDTQLVRYGQDSMRVMSTGSVIPAPGFKYGLHREYNATGANTSVKWEWDENGSIDGNPNPARTPEISINDTEVYDGVGSDWTQDHLVINYSAGENTTVWFTSQFKGGALTDTSTGGSLWRLKPFNSGNVKVENLSQNKFVFDTSLYYNKKGGDERTYGPSMVWFQNDIGDVSNPIFVWMNATPEVHDGVIDFNSNGSSEEVTFDDFWKIADLNRRQRLVVDVDTSSSGGQLHVLGPDLGSGGIQGEGSSAGVTVTDLGAVNSTHDRYEVLFRKPALGGYSIHWGSGSSFQWSDPLFVIVGQEASLNNQRSQMENLVDPNERSPDRYFSDSFAEQLDRSIPGNVDYRFAVYRNGPGGSREVVRNTQNEKLAINEGRTPVRPVTVTREFVASRGTTTRTYSAELTLWYK